MWLCLLAQPAYGVTIVIGSPRFPRPVVLISIGRRGGAVSEVNFTIPSANVGDGTPIIGTPPIRILVVMEAMDKPVHKVTDFASKIIQMVPARPALPTTQPMRRYIITPRMVNTLGVNTPPKVARPKLPGL